MLSRRQRHALALAGLGLLVVFACTKKPDDAVFDNPFDPNGTGGDPLPVTAVATGSGVTVSWRTPNVPRLSRYVVLRSLSSSTGFVPAGEVIVTDGRVQHVFHDAGYARNRSNYYKVRAYRGTEASLDSRVVAAGVFAPPELSFPGDSARVRHVLMRVRTDAGDSVEVAEAPDFSNSRRQAIHDSVTLVDLDLTPADRVGTRKRAYARVWSSGSIGSAVTDSVVVAFGPRVGFTTPIVVQPMLVLRSRAIGLSAFRAATSRALLATTPWIDNPTPEVYDSLEVQVVLPPGLQPQPFFAESRSDFGFSRIDSLLAAPRAVGPATIVLDSMRTTTSNPTIDVHSTAAFATEMRFAESPDFAGAPWQPFAIHSNFVLSPAPGLKTVYAIFHNGVDLFGQSTTAQITLLGDSIP